MKGIRILRSAAPLRAAAAVLVLLAGCGRREPIQKQTRFMMDTYVTIQIPGGPEWLPLVEKALDRMEEVDRKFNGLNPSSPVYAFNRCGTPIDDPEIVSLIRMALDVSRRTDGAFDITVYPLVELWGFFGKNPALPSDREIRSRLSRVGWTRLSLRDGRVYRNDRSVQIDLGAIAKGYAVGEAAGILRKEGVRSALIDAGGDIYAIGKIRGRPWKIGIRDPRGNGVIGSVDVSDLTVVTSGDYERYFEIGGVRYHHILDPHTGYPTRGLRSATVVTSDAALGDALSTAVFVLGARKGREFLEKTGLAEGVWVDSTGAVTSTKGFDPAGETSIQLINKETEP